MIDISKELVFQTARSGGKGGQNVNKVETAVTAFWDIQKSGLLTPEQKEILSEKLSHRINADGLFFVKSQTHRSQLANKEEARKKMAALIANALHRKKPRFATSPSRQSKQKRIDSKKRSGYNKLLRRKIDPGKLD